MAAIVETALGSHVVPWIVLQLFTLKTLPIGLAAAAIYGGIWYWVRGDIRAQYAAEIAAKKDAEAK